jgi:hypothetical protein
VTGVIPPALAPVWRDVAAALPASHRGEPREVRPAGPAESPSARVWRVALEDGPRLALKLAAPGAPLDAEAWGLRWLGQRGAPVPAVLAVDPTRPAAWLALAWCGDTTLDEAVQSATPWKLAALGRRLAVAASAVERAYRPVTAGLRRQATWHVRVEALREQTGPWIAAAPKALAWLAEGRRAGSARAAECLLNSQLDGLLERTLAAALGAEADVGSLDYNARNVILGERPSAMTLLDFAATGVDWPERRFVQYGTATGAGPTGGDFRSVIGPASVRAYATAVAPQREADAHDVARAVDAHDVLLLLTAATGLRAVAGGVAHPERAQGWADVSARRVALRRLLRRRLVVDGPAEALRAALRRG